MLEEGLGVERVARSSSSSFSSQPPGGGVSPGGNGGGGAAHPHPVPHGVWLKTTKLAGRVNVITSCGGASARPDGIANEGGQDTFLVGRKVARSGIDSALNHVDAHS